MRPHAKHIINARTNAGTPIAGSARGECHVASARSVPFWSLSDPGVRRHADARCHTDLHRDRPYRSYELVTCARSPRIWRPDARGCAAAAANPLWSARAAPRRLSGLTDISTATTPA